VFTAADLAGRTEPLCVSGEVHTPERLQRVVRSEIERWGKVIAATGIKIK